jgi:hypothetical protein
MAGWEDLRQIFIDNGLEELANIITGLAQDNVDAPTVIYEELRKTKTYQDRFKGNFERQAKGLPTLTEGEYINQEIAYAKVFTAYSAGTLANKDTYARMISGDVDPVELGDRFSVAYDRVTKAASGEDQALLGELKKMYPGITNNELATSILLGEEGSRYLNTKLNVAEIKAAETEAGIKSVLGADFLESQGITRAKARQDLSRVAAQKTGYEQASSIFGETSTEGLQQELEQENLLGQTSKRTKRLASQARAQFAGTSGITTGSLGKKKQV